MPIFQWNAAGKLHVGEIGIKHVILYTSNQCNAPLRSRIMHMCENVLSDICSTYVSYKNHFGVPKVFTVMAIYVITGYFSGIIHVINGVISTYNW